jgi:hypothetical protein
MACLRSRSGDLRPERKAAGADVSRAADASTVREVAPGTLVAASATALLLEGFTRIE